jgi:NitT/TauT family transport system ATP-binding protein
MEQDDTVVRQLGSTDQGTPLLELDNVSKTYSNGVQAIANLSLEIAEGSFVSLLGPSGCGKTTILRLIANLLKPSEGQVRWPQSGAEKLDAGDIGFVFQEPTLMPWQTVFGNVYLPLKLQGVSLGAAHGRVMEMIEAAGLADFANAYPRELSGGMRMRVSIARSLVTGPRLLLMDEPFAALDEITRHQLNDDLLGLWSATGVTIVFVTHSVLESAYLANRIVVMSPRPGRIFKDLPLRRGGGREKDYRLSGPYHEICRTVSHALRDATQLENADR